MNWFVKVSQMSRQISNKPGRRHMRYIPHTQQQAQKPKTWEEVIEEHKRRRISRERRIDNEFDTKWRQLGNIASTSWSYTYA